MGRCVTPPAGGQRDFITPHCYMSLCHCALGDEDEQYGGGAG